MLRVLTKAEELATRTKSFARLRAGTLFDLGGQRYFIAARKVGKTVEVIALDAANVRCILGAEPCTRARLHFDDLRCLNVRSPPRPARRP